ncbi:hypothetical protein KRP22_013447 [Phytophthora ramorum]|nr:Secreted RxLR effector protein 124 [Phytophthora ramorum]
MAPPPLVSASVVCRSHPRIAALPHISETISGFLDFSVRWSLPDACGFRSDSGALRLVQRVAAHRALHVAEARGVLQRLTNIRTNITITRTNMTVASLVVRQEEDVFYRQKLFTLGMAHAAARGDVDVLQWLVRQFPGCYVTLAVEEAAGNGHLKVLQWLNRSSRAGHIRDEGGGNTQPLEVFWVAAPKPQGRMHF